ncbi:hypothetical protein BDN71DRAFT_1400300 [Pleurotus eryngii]|uniref:PCI domain-containing protein n=1 Tax=Pleurotus eryngii TaxID=5323 RepID=A0A9P5ZMU9_PLEER|nr:hypothetical protein BDN71DRAFT_1400300 [Pleurotus eryngii]
MDLGSNFHAKLEPFLLIGKSMKGAAAAKLISDAISAPGVFVFSELLELPNIQELATHEQYASHHALLQVFSYKTYEDYLQRKDSLPPLNQAQTVKLKYLSIVTLASERRILPYSTLLKALDMLSIRELEDLIIDAIYLDILRGKLDQKEEQLEVEYTMGRDLELGKLETVLEALKDWHSTTAAVLTTLDEKLVSISSAAAAAKAEREGYDKELNGILKEIVEKQKDKSMTSAMGGQLGRRGTHDSMDIDEPENAKGKSRRAPQEALSKQQRKRNRF